MRTPPTVPDCETVYLAWFFLNHEKKKTVRYGLDKDLPEEVPFEQA